METKKTQRRVGTTSFGILLIAFGILFLLHLFLPALNYVVIFRLWPCIFIALGIEVLVETRKSDQTTFVYDTGAIFMCILLSIFAMGMAVVDYGIQQSGMWHI